MIKKVKDWKEENENTLKYLFIEILREILIETTSRSFIDIQDFEKVVDKIIYLIKNVAEGIKKTIENKECFKMQLIEIFYKNKIKITIFTGPIELIAITDNPNKNYINKNQYETEGLCIDYFEKVADQIIKILKTNKYD